jgi:putative transcription antitermination factor YqgF
MPHVSVDYGGKRVGIAVSESDVLATAHSVLANRGDADELIDRIARIGDEVEAERYVVGIARRALSGAGEQKFRDFAERLRQKTCKDVVLWDETLSTVEAAEQLRASGRKGRHKAGNDIDMYAARVILQSYLDDRNGRKP